MYIFTKKGVIKIKTSEAQRRANDKYNKANMKLYSVNMPIKLHEEMMKEVERIGTNRNAYTISAIKEKLAKNTNNN